MFYKPYNLGWFELHAVDHCNLNCINCNHHSLFFKKKEHNAADYFPHIDEMIRRNIKFNQIGILGGEPFLHSNLFGFVNSIKQRYKKNIVITTNGFWLGKDYSKYDNIFRIIEKMFVSIYPTIESSIGIDKINKSIEEIRTKYNLDIVIRSGKKSSINSFIEVKFTTKPEIPTSFCKAQGDCTNLLPEGKIARCGVGAYAKKNPNATFEFLSKTEDMFYDLTKDNGRDFGEWKTKYPLESCNYCSVWKKNWVSWKNSKNTNKNDHWPKLI